MKPGLNPRLEQEETLQRCSWPKCRAACCVYGTWIDESQVDDILANASLVQPHLPADRRDPAIWFGEEIDTEAHLPRGTVKHTTVVPDPAHYGGSACLFMLPDFRCALQVAGEAAGEHPWRFKPFYCILHPLDLDEAGRITLDEIRHFVDEPASCSRPGKTPISLNKLFAEEIEYLNR